MHCCSSWFLDQTKAVDETTYHRIVARKALFCDYLPIESFLVYRVKLRFLAYNLINPFDGSLSILAENHLTVWFHGAGCYKHRNIHFMQRTFTAGVFIQVK